MNAKISVVGLFVILRYLCRNKRELFIRINWALGFYRKRREGNDFYTYGVIMSMLRNTVKQTYSLNTRVVQ